MYHLLLADLRRFQRFLSLDSSKMLKYAFVARFGSTVAFTAWTCLHPRPFGACAEPRRPSTHRGEAPPPHEFNTFSSMVYFFLYTWYLVYTQRCHRQQLTNMRFDEILDLTAIGLNACVFFKLLYQVSGIRVTTVTLPNSSQSFLPPSPNGSC